ncbi:MAG: hypothetical protein ABH825_03175, partial [Candidatus Omnitrophota bacterium]
AETLFHEIGHPLLDYEFPVELRAGHQSPSLLVYYALGKARLYYYMLDEDVVRACMPRMEKLFGPSAEFAKRIGRIIEAAIKEWYPQDLQYREFLLPGQIDLDHLSDYAQDILAFFPEIESYINTFNRTNEYMVKKIYIRAILDAVRILTTPLKDLSGSSFVGIPIKLPERIERECGVYIGVYKSDNTTRQTPENDIAQNILQIWKQGTRVALSHPAYSHIEPQAGSALYEYFQGRGIDGNMYQGAPVDITNKAKSDSLLERLRADIQARVASRDAHIVDGEDAVSKVDWLFGKLDEYGNCSDPHFKDMAIPHMREVRRLIEELRKDAPPELRIAALLHDADRFFDGYYVMKKDNIGLGPLEFDNYYKPVQHPAMVAEFIAPLLKLLGIEDRLRQKIDLLARNHEDGFGAKGIDPALGLSPAESANLIGDCDMLRDADSISAFTPAFLDIKIRSAGVRALFCELWQKYTRAHPERRALIDSMLNIRSGEFSSYPNGRTARAICSFVVKRAQKPGSDLIKAEDLWEGLQTEFKGEAGALLKMNCDLSLSEI